MRRLLFLFGVVLLASPALAAGPAADAGPPDLEPLGALSLDLESVVALALERNAALRAEGERREEVLAGVEEAAADAWPQIDVVSSWTRSRNPALLNSPDFEDIVELFPDFEPGEEELWSGGVRVSQPIYTGGQVEAAIELAELVVDVTDAQIESVRLDVALAAAASYYRLLSHRAAADAVAAQERARRGALEVVEARYELGDATRLELLRARAGLAEVAPAAAEIEGRRRTEESRLRALLGLDPEVELELRAIRSPAVSPADISPADISPADRAAPDEEPGEERAAGLALPRLVALAAAERPEIRDLELQIRALGEQRTVEVAEGRPQVEFSGAYGRQARLPENLDDDLFDDWRVTVAMSWNVFDGGRRDGVVAQIESRRDQARWRLEELRRRVVAEIQEAHAAWKTASEREDAARRAVEAAIEAERVAGESYELGVALQAEVLDAQDLAVRSRLALTEATLERRVQAARLRRAVGLLPTEPFPFPQQPDQDSPR